MQHGLNHDLGETHDLLRESVYLFSQREIAPIASEIDSNKAFPTQRWRKLGDLGLLGITVDETRRCPCNERG